MTKIEKRSALTGVEARASDEKRTLVGYAAVFNSDADIGGWFTERFSPGSFTAALSADVRALVDHDAGRVIGRTKSGTLRMSQDATGLRVEIDVPDTTDGNDLWTLVDRGDISGMSISFRALKQEWDESQDPPLRTITDAELIEVSAVAFPAYDDTSIGRRALEEYRAAQQSGETNTDETDADEERADCATEGDNESETDPAAQPVSRKVANVRRRLSMGLELKVRTNG